MLFDQRRHTLMQSHAARIRYLAEMAQSGDGVDYAAEIHASQQALEDLGCTQADIYWRVCVAAVQHAA